MKPKPPDAKRKTWLPPLPAKAGAIDRRAIQRLAEAGVSFDDIVVSLELGPRLERDPKLREELERFAELHGARFRAAVAKRLFAEAVGAGKATPLLALARHVLGVGSEIPERALEHGIVDRVAALLDEIKVRK